MSTWTHFDEDSYRLPEGMKRIGCDADTQVYTFQDRNGKLYKGEPGSDYGVLTPVEKISIGSTRTGVFDSGEERSGSPVSPGTVNSTFHDILPATSITSTKSPVDKPLLSTKLPSSSPKGERSPRSRFVEVVRKSTVPRMQGVAHELRRSMTTARQKGRFSADRENLLPRTDHFSEETERVRHRGSHNLTRSDSSVTTDSGVSIDTPMIVKQ